MKLKNHKLRIKKTGCLVVTAFTMLLTSAMACHEHYGDTHAQTKQEKQGEQGKSWMRPAHAGKNTAAYFCVCGHDLSEGVKITAVTSDIARSIELHDHINDKGIMRMRPVEFVEIKDGRSGMKPGGKHIMIMGLKKDLKVGDKVDLTLQLEKADGSRTEKVVQFVVQ